MHLEPAKRRYEVGGCGVGVVEKEGVARRTRELQFRQSPHHITRTSNAMTNNSRFPCFSVDHRGLRKRHCAMATLVLSSRRFNHSTGHCIVSVFVAVARPFVDYANFLYRDDWCGSITILFDYSTRRVPTARRSRSNTNDLNSAATSINGSTPIPI